MATPFIRQPSKDNTFLFLGNTVSILVSGEDTEGKYTTLLTEERSGFEPPPHIHTKDDENFYLLEGEITYFIGDEVIHATPGMYVHAPKGIPHTFKVNSGTAKVLLTLYPSGFEQFVKELSTPVPELLPSSPAGPPSQEQIEHLVSTAARFGIEINRTRN